MPSPLKFKTRRPLPLNSDDDLAAMHKVTGDAALRTNLGDMPPPPPPPAPGTATSSEAPPTPKGPALATPDTSNGAPFTVAGPGTPGYIAPPTFGPPIPQADGTTIRYPVNPNTGEPTGAEPVTEAAGGGFGAGAPEPTTGGDTDPGAYTEAASGAPPMRVLKPASSSSSLLTLGALAALVFFLE